MVAGLCHFFISFFRPFAWPYGELTGDEITIANYHYGDVAKSILIILGISFDLRVDFPNVFHGFTRCSAGQ